MLTSLFDAQPQTGLILHAVPDPGLAAWLARLGLHIGSRLLRHTEEAAYHPVRVRGEKGDMVVPAGLGTKIFVHTGTGERKPLVEMERGEKAYIKAMACGSHCEQGLAHFGLEVGKDIECIRLLPHMDYITRLGSSGALASAKGRQPESLDGIQEVMKFNFTLPPGIRPLWWTVFWAGQGHVPI